MPNYSYECDDGHRVERSCTIAEMETWERYAPNCPACAGALRRDYDIRRHILFHEGWNEHVSEAGAYISSMDQLKRVARENGNYSQYALDLGGAFPGSREGRWV